ncbi:MAG: flagellar assembly protein FliW [Phycisphaeraceae bacterium]|nr:flagellar assembly protein FliW [Phycisphaeraceae bacterium]
MQVRTTRFGSLEISDERVISFPKGLLGFADCRRFCLLEPAEDACFFWLQSLDEPSLAFVVTDPSFFIPEYTVPIREDQMVELKLPRLEDAQVFVIVNKVDLTLTGNLQGPLVINTLDRVAEQFVLAEKRWTTRHPLVNLQSQATTPAAMSA